MFGFAFAFVLIISSGLSPSPPPSLFPRYWRYRWFPTTPPPVPRAFTEDPLALALSPFEVQDQPRVKQVWDGFLHLLHWTEHTLPTLLANIAGLFPLIPVLDKRPTQNYTRLGHFNLDPQITIAGFSGGAFFSVQLGFIFSSIIRGVGVFSGAPYPVMHISYKEAFNTFNSAAYYKVIDSLVRQNQIDSTKNIQRTRVYINHGKYDPIPNDLPLLAAGEFLHYGMPRESLKLITNYPVGHCVPVENGPLGSHSNIESCFQFDEDLSGACNCKYHAPYDMLRHIIPDFETPQVNRGWGWGNGALFKFDQGEFVPGGNAYKYGLWHYGWAYVPKRCSDGFKCKLHFYWQPCGGSRPSVLKDEIPTYIERFGYVPAADLNDMILIFPNSVLNGQVGTIGGSCFDFFGFANPKDNLDLDYATREGLYSQFFKRIYDRLVHGI